LARWQSWATVSVTSLAFISLIFAAISTTPSACRQFFDYRIGNQ
jgi:hypothetical protein